MRVKEGNKEQDILEAAILVFAEKGFHNTKISQIAEKANVATGSIYIYFKNKEELLLKIFETLWMKLFNELRSLLDNEVLLPLEKVDLIIDLIFDIFTENPSLAMVFVNEQNHLMFDNRAPFIKYYEKFLDLGMEAVQEGIDKNVFSSHIDNNIFRYYIFGAIRNLLYHWARKPKKFPITKIRQNVKYLIKHGILT